MYSSPGPSAIRAHGPARVIADLRGCRIAWSAGVDWHGLVGRAASAPVLRLIIPDAAERARIRAAEPGLTEMARPTNSHAGLEAAVPSIGNWRLVLAHPDLPEEAGFRLAAALRAARATLARHPPRAAETTARNTALPPADSTHPRVRRSLRGAGLPVFSAGPTACSGAATGRTRC